MNKVFSFKNLLLYNRWPWHVLFWLGYVLFRFWFYYITVKYSKPIFLEYMLLSEILFVIITYFTIWLFKRLFENRKYGSYFAIGTICWLLYLYGRTAFQFYYLRNERGFQEGPYREQQFLNMLLPNIAFVIVYFLFITACKFFKDGYIKQQFEAERKEQQLIAEINNLKSQIAPHFLFNTLNNLYGLAVQKSDKLPDLMLRLSDLLRHSLYETQKPVVSIGEEMTVLKSYIKLERIRLEEDLKLSFENKVPEDSPYYIAPLILIVFVENAFKHARFVQFEPVDIYIGTYMEGPWFCMEVRNNYNKERDTSSNGIGLMNVQRRLELLYGAGQHELFIHNDESFYSISLKLQLEKKDGRTKV